MSLRWDIEVDRDLVAHVIAELAEKGQTVIKVRAREYSGSDGVVYGAGRVVVGSCVREARYPAMCAERERLSRLSARYVRVNALGGRDT